MTPSSNTDPDAHALAIFAALGRFVVVFERVCAAMRQCVTVAFRREGLKNQGLARVVVNGKAAATLRETLGAIYTELKDQDEDDKLVVSKMLARVKALGESRNTLLHAEWYTNFDYEGANEEFIALAIRHSSGQKIGAQSLPIDVSEKTLAEYIQEATELLILLNRLTICLNQNGYKVSEFVTRPL